MTASYPYQAWDADTREYLGRFTARGICMLLVQHGNTNVDAAIRAVIEDETAIDISGLTILLAKGGNDEG